jgi:multicomponent Na+:H+ antiporter subunit F
MLGDFELLTLTSNLVLGMLILTMILSFIRLVRGPSLPDRVVALDLIGSTVAGIIAVYAVANRQPIFVDVAIVMALVIFLGTIAFARFVEKRITR